MQGPNPNHPAQAAAVLAAANLMAITANTVAEFEAARVADWLVLTGEGNSLIAACPVGPAECAVCFKRFLLTGGLQFWMEGWMPMIRAAIAG